MTAPTPLASKAFDAAEQLDFVLVRDDDVAERQQLVGQSAGGAGAGLSTVRQPLARAAANAAGTVASGTSS